MPAGCGEIVETLARDCGELISATLPKRAGLIMAILPGMNGQRTVYAVMFKLWSVVECQSFKQKS